MPLERGRNSGHLGEKGSIGSKIGAKMNGGEKMKKMRSLLAILAFLSILSWGLSGIGADYPQKPIRMIVPYAAGGGNDVLARACFLC